MFSIPVVAELNRGRVEIQRKQLQYLHLIQNMTKQHLPQVGKVWLLQHDTLIKYLNVGDDVDSRPGFFLHPTHSQRLPPRHDVLIHQLFVITCQSDCTPYACAKIFKLSKISPFFSTSFSGTPCLLLHF